MAPLPVTAYSCYVEVSHRIEVISHTKWNLPFQRLVHLCMFPLLLQHKFIGQFRLVEEGKAKVAEMCSALLDLR